MVKVARWVLRGTTLGNRCRLLDKGDLSNYEGFLPSCQHGIRAIRVIFFNLVKHELTYMEAEPSHSYEVRLTVFNSRLALTNYTTDYKES